MTDPTTLSPTPEDASQPMAPAKNGDTTSPSALAVQRAAAILDVLAGQRSTSEAAQALGISLNHYYLLERRALEGLTAACEVRSKGPKGPSLESQLQALQRQLEQCQNECQRQAALVRATQRAAGLTSLPDPTKTSRRNKKSGGTTRKRRRPAVRALRAAQTLRKNSSRSKSASGLEHQQTTDQNSDSPSTKERRDGTSG